LRGVNPEDFSYTLSPAPPGSLQPGQAVVFSVGFAPRVTGIRTATLQLFDNAANSPQSVFLTGNGILPADLAIAMTANALGNPLLKTQSNVAHTIQVTNTSATGAYNVTVNTTVPAGEGSSLVSLVPSGTCTHLKTPVGSIRCSLGSFAAAGAATVMLTTTYSGTVLPNNATVTSLLDPNSANNTATVP